MAVRSDFNVIPIREHLGDNSGDINTDFPFKGKFSSVKTFRIEGEPVDDAFSFNQSYPCSQFRTCDQDQWERPSLAGYPSWPRRVYHSNEVNSSRLFIQRQ